MMTTQSAANDNSKTFQSALFRFLTEAQLVIEQYHEKHCPTVASPTLEVDLGRRYVRVMRMGSVALERSAFCFVDMTNGDVLKPDGWRKPAKGRRGNIFAADHGRGAVGPHGAHCFR